MTTTLDRATALIHEGRNPGAALMASTAERISGAKVEWLTSRLAVASLGDREIIIDGPIGNETSVAAAIVRDKLLTKQILRDHGVSTPRGGLAPTVDDALALFREIGGPVVVKPRLGARGKGVTVDVRSESEMRSAYARAVKVGRGRPLIEEHVDIAREYRAMASATSCESVVHRVLPQVVGDGQSTVRQLIDAKNAQRLENPALSSLLIPRDRITRSTLDRQGLALDTVLPIGAWAVVRSIGGISGGGEPHEVMDSVGEEVKSTAIAAIRALGMRWGGVDIVSDATGRPLVIEVNASAGFSSAAYAVVGTPRDVSPVIWRERLEISRPDPVAPLVIPAVERTVQRIGEQDYLTDDTRRASLSAMLFAWAEAHGAALEYLPTVVRITNTSGHDYYVGRTGAGPDELFAVRRLVRDHIMVRKMLARAGIRRPKGRRFESQQQLASWLDGYQGRVAVVPAESPWGDNDMSIVRAAEARQQLAAGPWFVQHHPSGTRARIFATRDRVLAVTCRDGRQTAMTGEALARAGEVAVRAVRAVPELPWGMVEVQVRNGGCLVAGLSMNPVMARRHVVVAGHMDEVFEYVIPSV
ncbi:ATP-binding protein [Nesterenkonia suensis]